MADADTDRLAEDYRRLRDDVGAVWILRDALRVTGSDALAFLDGQLSQDIKALAVGASVDSLLLQPHGKVVAMLRVTREDGDAFVLDTDAGFGDSVVERLERFKLRTKATIERDPDWKCVAVRGPRAHEVASGVVVDWPGLAGVDIIGHDPRVPADVPLVGIDAYEVARIEAGVPVMGRELTDETIPAEATGVVERSVSFTKGCFTGQELVARIDSRGGNVRRRLCGVELSATSVPATGSELVADGAPVGVITPAACSPRTGAVVALAYVARKVELPAAVDGGVVKGLPLS
ncbi:MAG: folate-binding protein YgfZ [Actinobacteria bacterium]|nr:folate-binding protein YgfZ [Actinomycetota bacterium]